MARNFGRLYSAIWKDEHFIAQPIGVQWMYGFLLSQPNLTHIGVLPLTLGRWARHAPGYEAGDIGDLIDQLHGSKFVVVDRSTEEVLVRSLIRNDGVYKQPKVYLAALAAAPGIMSVTICQALLEELDRLPDTAPADTTKAIAEVLTTTIGTASVTPPDTPTDTHREPSAIPPARTQARSPALSPTPTPAPTAPAGAGAELVLATIDGQPTAQTILSEYIDRCSKTPPGNVIGQLGKHLKAMLGEGIDPDDIRRGMAAWHQKGLHPSTLPSVVNEVMNRPAARSTTDERVNGALALARQFQEAGE